jgi:molybdate transport system substrate-binding protein
LTACAPKFERATVRLSFAGSDELAAQIRQGLEPDVYAAANTSLPQDLHADGLLGKPVEYATNELVLAVPRDSDIRTLDDLTQHGVKIAIGSESVPIGSYTREVLTDVKATGGKLNAIALPAELQPTITYAAGVVKGAKQPAAARTFVRGLLHGVCAAELDKAGFGSAP